jgi:regulation of enolase protein 1 (concanavalin A-like superfamily)
MKRLPLVNLMAIVVGFTISGNVRVAAKETRPYTSPKASATHSWGKAIDPDGDCRFFVSGEALLISVPGLSYPHDLAAEIGITNAPRVLQSVSGDFTVEVKIDGRFEPGEKTTMPGRVGYNGAGLLVMSDSKNVVCLARAAMNHPGKKPTAYTNFEMRTDGDLERIGDANDFALPKSGSVFLRLSRQGQRICGAVSTDGKRWKQLQPKELPMSWSRKLQVGVVAISTSKEEFNPRFSRFKIVK